MLADGSRQRWVSATSLLIILRGQSCDNTRQYCPGSFTTGRKQSIKWRVCAIARKSMRWSRYNVWEDWDEREKEIERDVFRKRTGKVKKNKDFISGQKGSTESRRGGEVQKYNYYHHCYWISSSLAAVVRMQKTVSRMAGNGGMPTHSTAENSWFGIWLLDVMHSVSWLYPKELEPESYYLLLVYSVRKSERHCACEVLSEVIRVNAAIHAYSHTELHPPVSRPMHRRSKLCMIMI